VPFVVRAVDVDETPSAGEPADSYLERIVDAKLAAVREAARADGLDAAGVLVADTVVVGPGGTIFGKPRDDDDARSMLARLAGKTHEVRTRFVLAPPDAAARPWHAETVTTRVAFRHLDAAEIDAYVAGGEGRDKAGSYAVQGAAAAFVARIEGSYTGVVGLPLCEVVVALRAAGWTGADA
jgi:septum formation protein